MSERIFLSFCPVRYLSAIGALLLGLTQISDARADSASCLEKVNSYVAELDELFSKERNWLTPYDDLSERYFPFRDCEVDALLEAVRRSHFIRSISHHSRADAYIIDFSNNDVLVSFTYHVSEKKSDPDKKTALWVHK